MADQLVENDNLKCLRCQKAMSSLGKLPLRTGGITGFFANWGETSEKIVRLDVYRCLSCGHVEFFDFDMAL